MSNMSMHANQSQKQRVADAQGKDVPMDYFLFSCLEQERTMRDSGKSQISWTKLVDGGGEPKLADDIANAPLLDLIRKMTQWYRENFPQLADGRPMDHEHLNDVIEPLVSLNRDIGRLYLLKCGEEIPEFESSVGNNRVWDDVSQAIRDVFPAQQRYYIRYVEWSHAAEPDDASEPGSRPPVGRYAPRYSRRDSGTARGGGNRRDSGSPRSGGSGRGRDRGRPGIGGNRDRGGPRRGGDRDRGGSRRQNFRDSQGRGNQRHGGRDRGQNRDSGNVEETALLDVYNAIRTLRKDQDLNEIALKPTNSFYRRMQHQKAVESGFSSRSAGEGYDRAVVVSRKNNSDD